MNQTTMTKSAILLISPNNSQILARSTASFASNDYDRLLELRKLLVVADGRWRKELELVGEREQGRCREKMQDGEEIQKQAMEIQRYKGEMQKLKKEN